jgi:hypothetical protein
MIAHWPTSERGRVRDGKRNISPIERHHGERERAKKRRSTPR